MWYMVLLEKQLLHGAWQLVWPLGQQARGRAKSAVPFSSISRTVTRDTRVIPHPQGREEKMSDLYVGIDVSKASLDVATSQDPDITTFGNDEGGCNLVASALIQLAPKLIVLEAT